MTNIRKWLLAIVAGVLALILSTGPAFAAPLPPAADPNDIDARATATLTIHLLQGSNLDPATFPANGLPLDPLPPTVKPLAGGVFTVTKIDGVDLTTYEGRQLAATYLENPALARDHLGESRTTAPTDANGITVVNDLPVGLYLVERQGAEGEWLITLPVPDPTDPDTWMYDVHMYPKTIVAPPPTTTTTTPPGTTPTTPVTQPPPGSEYYASTYNPPITAAPNNAWLPSVLPTLPRTGADLLLALGIALVLTAAGMGLLAISRRRTMRE